MERRLFLNILFKGAVASTVAYSLPIVGETFSDIITSDRIFIRDMRVPLQLRPGGLFGTENLMLTVPSYNAVLNNLFAKDDAFFTRLNAKENT